MAQSVKSLIVYSLVKLCVTCMTGQLVGNFIRRLDWDMGPSNEQLFKETRGMRIAEMQLLWTLVDKGKW